MKSFKLIFILLLFPSVFAFGQTFGLKSGLNISTLSKGFDYNRTAPKPGLYAGAYLNLKFTSKLSFQPEIIYNGLGARVDYTLNDPAVGNKFDRRLSYISVPLIIQYEIIPSMYLEIGPQFSFLINAKEKYQGLNGEEMISNIPKDFLNRFDFGIGIGAGYDFLQKVGLSFRYVTGLTDIYKYNKEKPVKNSTLQIGLTYKIK